MTQTISNEIDKIAQRLLEKSREGKVNWIPAADIGIGPAGMDDFAVNLPEYSLNIYRQERAEARGIVFAIYNNAGNNLLSILISPDEPARFQIYLELLDLARYKARRINDIIEYLDRVLTSSDSIGLKYPFGEPPPDLNEDELPF